MKYLVLMTGMMALAAVVVHQRLKEGISINDVVPSKDNWARATNLQELAVELSKELMVPIKELSDEKLEDLMLKITTYIFEGNLLEESNGSEAGSKEQNHAKSIIRYYVALNEEKTSRNSKKYRAEIEEELKLEPHS